MAKYKLFYRLTHENGALVDETGKEPFEFELGDGQLDPCLESCVVEAKIGKLQTFLLSSDEAFGPMLDDAIVVISRDDFPSSIELALGAAIEFNTPINDSYVGCIEKINGDEITVNFNHPLAGCGIAFRIEVLECVL